MGQLRSGNGDFTGLALPHLVPVRIEKPESLVFQGRTDGADFTPRATMAAHQAGLAAAIGLAEPHAVAFLELTPMLRQHRRRTSHEETKVG